MAYKERFIALNESLAGCGTLRSVSTYEDWLKDLQLLKSNETCGDKVPSSTYLLVEDDTLIGIGDIRHHINHPILSVWGGHIGYSIDPLHRKKGYGKALLGLLLKEASKLEISEVLVTCDLTNKGSEKIILSNGGIFDKTISVEEKQIHRYFIKLS